jgi:hypothetical protein
MPVESHSPKRPCVIRKPDGARAVPWTIRRPYSRTGLSNPSWPSGLGWPLKCRASTIADHSHNASGLYEVVQYRYAAPPAVPASQVNLATTQD